VLPGLENSAGIRNPEKRPPLKNIVDSALSRRGRWAVEALRNAIVEILLLGFHKRKPSQKEGLVRDEPTRFSTEKKKPAPDLAEMNEKKGRPRPRAR